MIADRRDGCTFLKNLRNTFRKSHFTVYFMIDYYLNAPAHLNAIAPDHPQGSRNRGTLCVRTIDTKLNLLI